MKRIMVPLRSVMMTSVDELSSSPTAVNFLDDVNQRITLDEFKKELPKTIEGILESRKTLEPRESEANKIANLFRKLHLDPNEMVRHARFDASKNYTRNLVATDDIHYTLLLLCWNPGKSSPIHDHPCDGCWMQVLQGKVRESRYARMSGGALECTSDETYREGQHVYINDSMGYHKIENPSLTQPAITLHLYCPPFAQCQIWMDPAAKSSLCKVTFYSTDECLVSNPQLPATVPCDPFLFDDLEGKDSE